MPSRSVTVMLLRAGHHVLVGEDDAVGADDEAGAEALDLLLVALGGEEHVEGRLLHPPAPGHAHRDDGGRHPCRRGDDGGAARLVDRFLGARPRLRTSPASAGERDGSEREPDAGHACATAPAAGTSRLNSASGYAARTK